MKNSIIIFLSNLVISLILWWVTISVLIPRSQRAMMLERERLLISKWSPRLAAIRETFGLPAKEVKDFEDFGDQLGEAFGKMLGAGPGKQF